MSKKKRNIFSLSETVIYKNIDVKWDSSLCCFCIAWEATFYSPWRLPIQKTTNIFLWTSNECLIKTLFSLHLFIMRMVCVLVSFWNIVVICAWCLMRMCILKKKHILLYERRNKNSAKCWVRNLHIKYMNYRFQKGLK